jgi:hypothetical protein
MEGDVLRLRARPHPAWNLRRVSRLLYGSDDAVAPGFAQIIASENKPPNLSSNLAESGWAVLRSDTRRQS